MNKKKYVCEFCESILGSKYALTQHHNSKTCRKSRGIYEDEYSCDYCAKNFARSYTLSRHLLACPDKRTDDLEKKYKSLIEKRKQREKEYRETVKQEKAKNKELSSRIKHLEKELDQQKGMIEGMQKAPDKKTIYNTAYVHPKLINLPISNIPALTQEFIEQKVSDGILTYSLAARGYAGMLGVICELISHENVDGVVERNYVCTDVSRNSFHRLLESKKWKADKGGRYLNNMIDTFQDVMEEYKNKVYQMYSVTSHDSPEWRQVNWERKSISKLYSGVVCKEGTEDREELVNSLRKDISKRAYV